MAVTCATCRHFVRYPRHPMLGACRMGEPSGCAAGFWATDTRWCLKWEAA